MRESVDQKARRYLGEGRLLVELVSGEEIRARCRGDGAVYELGCAGGSWSCSCPARTRCAHLVTLRLVTVAALAGEPAREPEPDLATPPVRAGFE